MPQILTKSGEKLAAQNATSQLEQKPPDLDDNGNPIDVAPPDLDDNGNPLQMNFATVNGKQVPVDDSEPGLLKRGYNKLMEPLLPEADTSGQDSLLGRGINIGQDTPIIKNIWPGGIHIPGASEIYNELLRPMSAPIGIGMMGLEGLIGARGGLSRGLPETAKTAEGIESEIKPQLTRTELPERVPVTRIVDKGLSIASDKPETYYNLGHLDDAKAAQLNDMYKGGKGEVTRTYLNRDLVDTSQDMSDEFGNKIIKIPTSKVQRELQAPKDIQLPASKSLLTPSQDQPMLGTGQPRELLHPNRLEPASEILGYNPKPRLEVVEADKPPATPESLNIPKPGQAKSFSDITPLTANATSADQTLASREITKPIADTIIKAQDEKTAWIAQTERELAELSKGLNKASRIQLGQLIDGQDIPEASPELRMRASQAREVLDAIHEQFPEGATKAGENVGYLENYFTHIQHQPDDVRSGIKSIIDHHLGIFKSEDINIPNIPGKQGIGDMFDRGMGKPSSPFTEERTGQASQLQYDINKVFPAYIESAAKVIFDKPAVESATRMLKDVPDSNLKELATWYIKNYSRYDAEAGLHNAWNKWANTIARTTARSLLGFNSGIQTLHLARVPANLWPELGSKYTGIGLRKLASSPVQSWSEAARLGLLQNEIRPFRFRTPMEKFDSISNFLSMADYVDKASGYFGYKQKFLDEGMSANDASLKAIRETKRVSQTSDPARQMKLMSAKSNVAGGEVVSKLGWQFKQVPAKIVEQYVRIATQAKSDPKQAARLLAGVGLSLAANEGLRTFHLDPIHMIGGGMFGAFGDTVYKVSSRLAKGDWQGALEETALWATPAGKSIQRQLNQGPSAIQP